MESSPNSLVELLGEIAGVEIERRRHTATLAMALLRIPDGRRLLLLERTYREGVVYILDPSEDEVDVAREGDLWKLWNSDRGVPLAGIV
jgi:hypothetical protein